MQRNGASGATNTRGNRALCLSSYSPQPFCTSLLSYSIPRQLALYMPGVLNTVSVAVPVPTTSPSTDHLAPIHIVVVESDKKTIVPSARRLQAKKEQIVETGF